MANKVECRDRDLFFFHSYNPQPDPATFKMHTHDRCELYLFLSGKGIFHVEGSAYTLHPGDMLVMRRAEAHYIEIDPRFPYERYGINFREELLRPFDPSGALLSPFLSREPGKNNQFRAADFDTDIYRRFWENMEQPGPDRRLHILTNLLPLLNEIYRAAEKKVPDVMASDTPAYPIVRFVNEHLYEPLSLETICKQFYISKPQLCRIFKQATGSTVWDYVTVKRLLAAQQLIADGVPAAHAAQRCGFGEYSSFYRAYRKRFHTSPREDEEVK